MQANLLVVDDKQNVRQLIKEYFGAQGYNVATASNGREALFVARDTHPDLILLDIMMPEMDGYTFVQTFRRESSVPIILLTAKLEETDKVIGLELGADDYVTKPFGMRELMARVRAHLRRTSNFTDEQSDVLRRGEVVLNYSTRIVKVSGEKVTLTPTEFSLLHLFMKNPGRVFSRDDLQEHLQGNSWEGAARTIDVHIRNLRQKIEPTPKKPQYLATVFGMGYRFELEDA